MEKMIDSGKCIVKLTGEGVQNDGFIAVHIYDFDNELKDAKVTKEYLIEVKE